MNIYVRRRLGLAAIALVVGIAAVACSAATHRAATTMPSTEISVDDGLIEVGESVSPFDEQLPAIANLDPELRAAVQAAATDAAAEGIPMVVTSGWRTSRYQQKLLDDATYKYGSLEEALKHVNTPERSTHITGDAVDIGFTDADSWLSQHGARYGLCQIYANEMWHFELATEPGGTCPQQKPDATA